MKDIHYIFMLVNRRKLFIENKYITISNNIFIYRLYDKNVPK